MAKGKKKSAVSKRRVTGKKTPRKKHGPKGVPWEEAEKKFVMSRFPNKLAYVDIAKMYGVHERTVENEAGPKKRGWKKKRDESLKKENEEFIELATKELAHIKLKDLEKVDELLDMVEKIVKDNPRSWKGKDLIAMMKHKLVLLGEPDVKVGGSVDFNDTKGKIIELINKKGNLKGTDFRGVAGRRK